LALRRRLRTAVKVNSKSPESRLLRLFLSARALGGTPHELLVVYVFPFAEARKAMATIVVTPAGGWETRQMRTALFVVLALAFFAVQPAFAGTVAQGASNNEFIFQKNEESAGNPNTPLFQTESEATNRVSCSSERRPVMNTCADCQADHFQCCCISQYCDCCNPKAEHCDGAGSCVPNNPLR
jgi:hypothetical protein